MLDQVPDTVIVAAIGLIGGVLLGLAARLGRFCTLGAIEDALYQRSDLRLRMWVLAIGVSGLLSFILVHLGALDPRQTIYHLAPFSPIASILGGLLFGYGMSIAGNCGFGALARFGGGDLRSFVIVLVMGISAYVMLSGPLAPLRVSFVEATAIRSDLRSFPQLLQSFFAVPSVVWGLFISAIITACALGSRAFLRNRRAVFWSLVVGFAIATGWAGTQWVARDGFSLVAVGDDHRDGHLAGGEIDVDRGHGARDAVTREQLGGGRRGSRSGRKRIEPFDSAAAHVVDLGRLRTRAGGLGGDR